MTDRADTIRRHDGKLVLRGWYLDDLRARAESSGTAECTRNSCLEPEANELAEWVLALLDAVESLVAERQQAIDALREIANVEGSLGTLVQIAQDALLSLGEKP